MARKSNSETEKILKLVSQVLMSRHDDILGNSGEISAQKICELLEEEYNVKVSRQTMTEYLTRDLERITPVELKHSSSLILQGINETIDDMNSIRKNASNNNDKIKAANMYFKGCEVKAKIIKMLTDAQSQANTVNKAQYIVTFGEPSVVEQEKQKEPFFKTGNGQVSIDDVVKAKKELEEGEYDSK
jgi:hypothetical protein